VIDLATRMVVGWLLAAHMRTLLVIDALQMTIHGGHVTDGAIFHSDRGTQGGFNWSSQHFDQEVWRWPMEPDRGRPSVGERLPRRSTNTYDPSNNSVSRRPIESAQYTSAEFDEFTAKNGIRRRRGRTGVCWYNAAAESFFATLKNEMYYRHTFAHSRASPVRRRRIHRGLLQPPTAALHVWLSHPLRCTHRPPQRGDRRGVINPRTRPRDC
jgi:transposase InsO family protein